MPTRTNLCPNPSMKNDVTGWFGPGGTWVRTTTANAGLPRTTAFGGPNAGNVVGPRITVTPGLTYVFSAYLYSSVASSFSVLMDFYAAGAFHSSSTSVPYSVGAGTVTRVNTGPVTIPAGVDQALLNHFGLDGAGEVTATLYEQTTEMLSFFDGDSLNAVWNGTVGNSTSTLTTTATTQTASDSFTLSESATQATGTFGSDSATLSESAKLEFGQSASDSAVLSELALLVTMEYDDLRGRVRISAMGFGPSVIRAVVYAKAQNEARFTEIRGGRIAIVGGAFSRPIDHYEFAAGRSTQYKIVALSSASNAPDVVVQESIVTRVDDLQEVWLKVIANPYLNRKITLTGWGEITREARQGVFNVIGRPDPVVVTDVHSSRRTTITALANDDQETSGLDFALSLGAPVFLQVPTHCALPSMYAVVGNYGHDRTAPRSHQQMFQIPLTEVAPPPLSVLGATMTVQRLVDLYPTVQDVLNAYNTVKEVLD